MNFSNTLKSHLMALIDEMDSHHYDFTRNPKTDFSRTKKWSFRSTFLFILSMEGNSLKNELLKFLILIPNFHRLLLLSSEDHKFFLLHSKLCFILLLPMTVERKTLTDISLWP